MQKQETTDEVKAMFTAWVEKLAHRVRVKYLTKKAPGPETISLEEISESQLSVNDLRDTSGENIPSFSFGDWRFEEAFSALSMEKQRILIMYFVEGLKPTEIAEELGCTPQHIYNQKYRALRQIRKEHRKRGGEV